jgi:hypothetical protein
MDAFVSNVLYGLNTRTKKNVLNWELLLLILQANMQPIVKGAKLSVSLDRNYGTLFNVNILDFLLKGRLP